MKNYTTDILAAVHESASDLHQSGLIDNTRMREFDELCLSPLEPMSPAEIKALREENHASQSAFAFHLNVSPRVVSEWENGDKKPRGAALKLLSLVKKNGLQSLL